jgi:bacteriochlorophyllide a dehydrogenase
MNTLAVILHAPESLALGRVELDAPTPGDVVVDIEWSGISTGTERLLWNGRMPAFPGMGYPLVPGYESVGRIISAGPEADATIGTRVFVPGARCYGAVRGLFGGAARRVVVPASRVSPVADGLAENGVLLALAATAHHAIAAEHAPVPELIVGHGVLGRLIARVAIALGHKAPVVWEKNLARHGGASGYQVVDPAGDSRKDYRSIVDVSGDSAILDTLIQHLTPGGEIVLAGFYEDRPSFAFPPAFMREMRLRIAAEWRPADLVAVQALIAKGTLSLEGLITHREQATSAAGAYQTAFQNPACLKMVLDWRTCS